MNFHDKGASEAGFWARLHNRYILVEDHTKAIGVEGLIELYKVDIAYNGFIEMRRVVFSSFRSGLSAKRSSPKSSVWHP